MSLKPFESVEELEGWFSAVVLPEGRQCPVCHDVDARDCVHSLTDMQRAIQATADDQADIDKKIAEAGDAPGETYTRFGKELAARATAAAAAGETRIVSATGGEKGQKLERFDLIPVDALTALARLYGKGAQKYSDDNWRKGYSWRLSIGALFRHVGLFIAGKSYDTKDGLRGGPCDVDANGKPIQTGEHHLICAAWHCFALVVFDAHKLGTDDRASCVDL